MVARPFLGQIGSTRLHFVHDAMRHRKAAVRAWTEAGDDVGIWQTRKSIPTFRRDVKISRQAHDRSSELTCLPLPRQALRLHRPRGHIIDTSQYEPPACLGRDKHEYPLSASGLFLRGFPLSFCNIRGRLIATCRQDCSGEKT
jgi:hypothetical protein